MARGQKSVKEGKGKNDIKSKKQESPKKKDQGHHFRCLPKTVATVFNQCIKKDETKMALVREMGFGAFESLPNYNLKQHMLKELVNIFDIHDNIIHSVHGEAEITTQKIGNALGLSWNGDPFDAKVDEKGLSEEDLVELRSSKCQAEQHQGHSWVLLRFDDNILPRDPLRKEPKEPEAQLPWITYWTGENLRKRLQREQNHTTGLVQIGMLRAAKERLERRNMDLKMGVIRRKDPESSESESAESDSEEGYESEEGSDESSSGG
ncbi:hypothetical protein PIB30_024702 [Stylosanthes scabra]|uniref:Uncharacterized protein n=1 Tax=Stylosanthes scabra TaxID=79078 RepID=A0ABU6QAE9_9FABA|nr:hypothetical protein [Stylosanthes scabra]